MSRKQQPHVRWMCKADMEAVLDAESLCRDPWSKEDILGTIRQRTCIGLVVEMGNKVTGYMLYELHRKHLAILRLVVHERSRREGCGLALVQHLVRNMPQHRRTFLDARVPEDALDVQLFLKQLGWRAVRVVRDTKYNDPDQYLFLYHENSVVDADAAANVARHDLGGES